MFGPVAELIETRRLVLAPLEAADAEEMAHVLGDPALHEFIGGAPLPLDELRARYERLVRGPAPYHQEGWLNWTVRHHEQAVGYVQATVLPGPRASLAWVIGVPWQGHGYATEAAQGMAGWLTAQGVTDLRASIHPDNHASAVVARRLGLSPSREYDDGEVVWVSTSSARPRSA